MSIYNPHVLIAYFTGTAFGFGTYFSADPHRSLHYAHSATPHEYILIVAKVLVGDFCVGHHGLKRPPLKGQVIDETESEQLRLRHPPRVRHRLCHRHLQQQQSAAAASTGNEPRFDSVVDDLGTPKTFVVFQDGQALPEFLVRLAAKSPDEKSSSILYL